MFDPDKQQVVIGRYVIIDESANYKWKEGEIVSARRLDNVMTIWMEGNKSEESRPTTISADGDTRRSQRTRFPSTRLTNHELFSDSDINDTGDIVQYALFADTKLLTWEQAIEIKEWREAMQEE
ncbi:hypothetical protein V8G54_021444 [Vigna mungo]|uniref:Uncharacterized protein n=1 Tax=Vigna mungo TaxID=3915 RepID=A0AAQ3NG43_VIGMU